MVCNSSPNIIRVIKSRRLRWAGNVAYIEERRDTYWVLVGKPQGWRPFGRPRRRWEDNINNASSRSVMGDMDWIDLAQDRGQVADSCECGNEPQNEGNFSNS
jgi:hypothetical protein